MTTKIEELLAREIKLPAGEYTGHELVAIATGVQPTTPVSRLEEYARAVVERWFVDDEGDMGWASFEKEIGDLGRELGYDHFKTPAVSSQAMVAGGSKVDENGIVDAQDVSYPAPENDIVDTQNAREPDSVEEPLGYGPPGDDLVARGDVLVRETDVMKNVDVEKSADAAYTRAMERDAEDGSAFSRALAATKAAGDPVLVPAQSDTDDGPPDVCERVIKWPQREAPTGTPSSLLVFKTLAWLRADQKRSSEVTEALFGDGQTPRLKKSIAAVVDVIAHMPVSVATRWLLATMRDYVTPKSFHEAFAEINGLALEMELWRFGLGPDGIRPETEAAKAAALHSDVSRIVSGEISDGVSLVASSSSSSSKEKVDGSVAAVVRALKAAFDSLPETHRAKMSAHVLDNRDDVKKALAPLGKLLARQERGVEIFDLVTRLVGDGRVPVSDLALVFDGEWGRLYSSLLICLNTIGPKPPWIKMSAA